MSNKSIEVRWKNGQEWSVYPVEKILHLPLEQVCHHFSGIIPVVAKQGGAYVVNCLDLKMKYQQQRKPCSTFSEILSGGGDRLRQPLKLVGLV